MSGTMIGQNPFYVTVIQPDNASIDWVIGETYTISWTDNLTQPVEIRLWDAQKSGGAAFETLAASVTGTTWVWDMDNTYNAGSGFYIQVRSTTAPTTYTDNGATFDLIYAPPNSITVLQPSVSGISWPRGTAHLISWTDNIDEPVDILLSNNGGTSYDTTLASSVTGTTWVWDIIDNKAPDTDYKIKVESSDFSSVFAVSSNNFSITKASGDFNEIYQPVDATSWAKSTTHIISWNDNMNEPVDIFYKKTNLGTGLEEIATDVVGSTYAWTIPLLVTGSDYYITIQSSLDPTVSITSSLFDITQTLVGGITAIYQPLTSTSWTVGTSHLISWLDHLEEPVDVYYSNNGGAEVLIDDDVVGTTLTWAIPSSLVTGTDKCKIIVRSSIDPSNVYLASALFDLTATTGSYTTVIQPSVSGITWALNTEHYISWDDDLLAGENVDIRLFKYATSGAAIADSVNGVSIAVANDVVGSTYVWDIDDGTFAAGYFRIKVNSSDDATIYDYSNNTFEITLSAGTTIDVLSPDGGEYWMAGTSHWISWDDNCPENVYVELWDTDGGYAKVVPATSGIPATTVAGSMYSWDIPSALTAKSTYRIKISSSLDSAGIYNFSAANFDIVPFGKSASYINGDDIASFISIYPNPTNGHFTVSSPLTINKVEVRNLLGQILYSTDVGDEHTSIDISLFDAGLYIVNVKVEGDVVAKKLFVY